MGIAENPLWCAAQAVPASTPATLTGRVRSLIASIHGVIVVLFIDILSRRRT